MGAEEGGDRDRWWRVDWSLRGVRADAVSFTPSHSKPVRVVSLMCFLSSWFQ